MTTPKISVILPVYQVQINWFTQSLNSIVNQTFTDFELIVVLDNPDSKELETVINKHKKNDERILLIKNRQNIGLPKSLNKGIQLSRGKYIARMDADDVSMPNRLETQFNYLETNLSISLCGGQAIKIDGRGNEIGNTNNVLDPALIGKLIPYINPMTHPTWMIRSKDIKEIGLYRNFPNAEDLDLVIRLAANSKKIINLPDILIKYRMHFESQSGKKSIEQRLCFKYIQRLYKERLQTGSDSFNELELRDYLINNRPKNFDSQNELWKARIFGERNFINKYFFIAKSFFGSSVNRNYLLDLARAKIIRILFKLNLH